MTDDPIEDAPKSCPDCGREAGPKGRIRHDEFCPRRTASTQDGASDRPPSSRRRGSAPRFTRDGFAKDVENLTIMLQGVIFAMRPDWTPDALDQQETVALSNAIADEVFTHKRLREWAQKAMEQSTHAVLAFVVIRIALPRIQRHQFMAAMERATPEQRQAMMAGMAAAHAAMQSQMEQAAAASAMMGEVPTVPPVYATEHSAVANGHAPTAFAADDLPIPAVPAEAS